MIRSLFLFCLLFSIHSCKSQTDGTNTPKLVGAPCEGCEAVFEFGERTLSSTDTLPGFSEEGAKIKVSGTIYKPDGKTPAPNVILYVYHTDQDGIYPPGEDPQGWERHHGYIRTWLKTDKNGHYAFYTLKPAPYPNRTDPAHIHYTILEPNGKYYYLDSCHFTGDRLLTENEINPSAPRGGSSGLLDLKKQGDLYIAERDLILGHNIPNYD